MKVSISLFVFVLLYNVYIHNGVDARSNSYRLVGKGGHKRWRPSFGQKHNPKDSDSGSDSIRSNQHPVGLGAYKYNLTKGHEMKMKNPYPYSHRMDTRGFDANHFRAGDRKEKKMIEQQTMEGAEHQAKEGVKERQKNKREEHQNKKRLERKGSTKSKNFLFYNKKNKVPTTNQNNEWNKKDCKKDNNGSAVCDLNNTSSWPDVKKCMEHIINSEATWWKNNKDKIISLIKIVKNDSTATKTTPTTITKTSTTTNNPSVAEPETSKTSDDTSTPQTNASDEDDTAEGTSEDTDIINTSA